MTAGPHAGLDPDWVAARVASARGAVPAAVLDGFIGTGQMSRNVRFRLAWPDGATGPSSVVVKIPSADAGTRSVSFEHGVYRRECEFYRTVASLVDVTAPAALAVHLDEDAGDFAIVLEDLVASEPGDQFAEPTDEQLDLAIVQAAALQAPVWGDTDGPAFAAYRDDAGERAAASGESIAVCLAVVFDRLGEGLDAEIAPMLERFAARAAVWTRWSGVPTTLVHGDFRPDNFMFGVTADAPPLVVVDWQTLALGLGVVDIAYLLGGALDPRRRRRVEHSLLARYRHELAVRGVEYPAGECLADYAIGSLHGVSIAIRATALAERTERGDALFTMMLNRHGRHALDLGILDRLDAAT